MSRGPRWQPPAARLIQLQCLDLLTCGGGGSALQQLRIRILDKQVFSFADLTEQT